MAPHLPISGEYFVFKLNPTQTLNLILDDPEVAKACEALGARCKRYIGCCLGWTGIPYVGTLFPFEMSIVSRGLVAYPTTFVTEDMSIPIFPTTHHPRGRKPLVVDPPLPWDNCYHTTPAVLLVRVLYREPDIRPRGKYALMPRYQTSILRFQQTHDDQWREKLCDMHETGGTDFEPPPIEDQEGIEEFYESLKTELDPSQLPVVNEDLQSYALLPEATSSLTDVASLESSDHYDGTESDSASRVTSHDSQRERRAHQYDYTPAIDITIDLETVPADELADNIFDFFEELLEMGEILLAHQAKVAAAVAEVQRQDAEFDAKVAAARQSSSSTEDSDAPREGPALSLSCISEKNSPLHQNTVSGDDTHQTRSEASSTTMASGEADQYISVASNPQPDGAHTIGVKAAFTTDISLSTAMFAPSTASEDLPPSHWRCWWSFTQTLKRVSTRMIQTTKKGKIATAD